MNQRTVRSQERGLGQGLPGHPWWWWWGAAFWRLPSGAGGCTLLWLSLSVCGALFPQQWETEAGGNSLFTRTERMEPGLRRQDLGTLVNSSNFSFASIFSSIKWGNSAPPSIAMTVRGAGPCLRHLA